MSPWAAYHKERQGWETIERGRSFISYSIVMPVCRIEECYVAPEERGQRISFGIADEVASVAKSSGCTHLWAQVGLNTLNANESLRAALAYGFRVAEADKNRIIMIKEIGEVLNG